MDPLFTYGTLGTLARLGVLQPDELGEIDQFIGTVRPSRRPGGLLPALDEPQRPADEGLLRMPVRQPRPAIATTPDISVPTPASVEQLLPDPFDEILQSLTPPTTPAAPKAPAAPARPLPAAAPPPPAMFTGGTLGSLAKPPRSAYGDFADQLSPARPTSRVTRQDPLESGGRPEKPVPSILGAKTVEDATGTYAEDVLAQYTPRLDALKREHGSLLNTYNAQVAASQTAQAGLKAESDQLTAAQTALQQQVAAWEAAGKPDAAYGRLKQAETDLLRRVDAFNVQANAIQRQFAGLDPLRERINGLIGQTNTLAQEANARTKGLASRNPVYQIAPPGTSIAQMTEAAGLAHEAQQAGGARKAEPWRPGAVPAPPTSVGGHIAAGLANPLELPQQAARGLYAGAIGMPAAGMAATASMLNPDNAAYREGMAVSQQGLEAFGPPVVEDVLSNPVDTLGNPAWWAYQGGQATGSILSLVGAGAPGRSMGMSAAALLKVTPKVAAQMGAVGGASSAAVAEAWLEGSHAYAEALEKGKTPDEAAAIAAKVAGANVALLGVTNLPLFEPALKSALATRFMRALSEGGQEAGQEVIGMVAQGEPLHAGQILTSGIVGGMAGAGFPLGRTRTAASAGGPETQDPSQVQGQPGQTDVAARPSVVPPAGPGPTIPVPPPVDPLGGSASSPIFEPPTERVSKIPAGTSEQFEPGDPLREITASLEPISEKNPTAKAADRELKDLLRTKQPTDGNALLAANAEYEQARAGGDPATIPGNEPTPWQRATQFNESWGGWTKTTETVTPTPDWLASQGFVNRPKVEAMKAAPADRKTDPIIVRTADGTLILDGHHGLAAAMEQGQPIKVQVYEQSAKSAENRDEVGKVSVDIAHQVGASIDYKGTPATVVEVMGNRLKIQVEGEGHQRVVRAEDYPAVGTVGTAQQSVAQTQQNVAQPAPVAPNTWAPKSDRLTKDPAVAKQWKRMASEANKVNRAISRVADAVLRHHEAPDPKDLALLDEATSIYDEFERFFNDHDIPQPDNWSTWQRIQDDARHLKDRLTSQGHFADPTRPLGETKAPAAGTKPAPAKTAKAWDEMTESEQLDSMLAEYEAEQRGEQPTQGSAVENAQPRRSPNNPHLVIPDDVRIEGDLDSMVKLPAWKKDHDYKPTPPLNDRNIYSRGKDGPVLHIGRTDGKPTGRFTYEQATGQQEPEARPAAGTILSEADYIKRWFDTSDLRERISEFQEKNKGKKLSKKDTVALARAKEDLKERAARGAIMYRVDTGMVESWGSIKGERPLTELTEVELQQTSEVLYALSRLTGTASALRVMGEPYEPANEAIEDELTRRRDADYAAAPVIEMPESLSPRDKHGIRRKPKMQLIRHAGKTYVPDSDGHGGMIRHRKDGAPADYRYRDSMAAYEVVPIDQYSNPDIPPRTEAEYDASLSAATALQFQRFDDAQELTPTDEILAELRQGIVWDTARGDSTGVKVTVGGETYVATGKRGTIILPPHVTEWSDYALKHMDDGDLTSTIAELREVFAETGEAGKAGQLIKRLKAEQKRRETEPQEQLAGENAPEVADVEEPEGPDKNPNDEDDDAGTNSNNPNAPIVFRSGNTRAPADLEGYIKAGQPVGITAQAQKAVVDRAIEYAKSGGKVFIDSGAFGNPDVDFDAGLTMYREFALALGSTELTANVAVVAPDKVGDADATRKLQTQYQDQIRLLIHDGLRVIVPVQVSDLMPAHVADAVRTFPKARIGLPGNKAAISIEQLREVLGQLKRSQLTPAGFHFLGVGEKNPQFAKLTFEVQQAFPDARITADSNRTRALMAPGRPAHTDVENLTDERAENDIDSEWDSDTTELAGYLFRGQRNAFGPAEIEQLAASIGVSADALRTEMTANKVQALVDGTGLEDALMLALHGIAKARGLKRNRPGARTDVIAKHDAKKPTLAETLAAFAEAYSADRMNDGRPVKTLTHEGKLYTTISILRRGGEILAIEARALIPLADWTGAPPLDTKANGKTKAQKAAGYPRKVKQIRTGDEFVLGDKITIESPAEKERQRQERAEAEARPSEYSKSALKAAFNLSDEQTEAVDTLVDAMGLDTAQIQVVKGGTPGVGALTSDDLFSRRIAELEAAADLLDTGEQQPRLPGAGDVREAEVATPEFEDKFSLGAQTSQAKPKQDALFGDLAPDPKAKPKKGKPADPNQDVLFQREAAPVPFPVADPAEAVRLFRARDESKGRLRDIPVDRLVATQDAVQPSIVARYVAEGPKHLDAMPASWEMRYGADVPIAIEHEGRFYLADGTHKSAAAKQRGDTTIQAIVYPVRDAAAVLFQDQAAAPFYSRLQRAVEEARQTRATGSQWKGIIKNAKIGQSADEYAFAHVDDLDPNTLYTKQEVLDYLKANEVTIVPVVFGDDGAKTSTIVEESRLTEIITSHGYEVVGDPIEVNNAEALYLEKDGEPVEDQEFFDVGGLAPPDYDRRINDLTAAMHAAIEASNAYGRTPGFDINEYERLREKSNAVAKEIQALRRSDPVPADVRTAFAQLVALHRPDPFTSKASDYQEPGADESTYREVLLTVPSSNGKVDPAAVIALKAAEQQLQAAQRTLEQSTLQRSGNLRYEDGTGLTDADYDEIAVLAGDPDFQNDPEHIRLGEAVMAARRAFEQARAAAQPGAATEQALVNEATALGAEWSANERWFGTGTGDTRERYRANRDEYERRLARRTEIGDRQEAIARELQALNGWRDGHDFYDDVEEAKNPIVRVRFNVRTAPIRQWETRDADGGTTLHSTADGDRVMFLEEVQPPKDTATMPRLFQKNWRELGLKWALRYAAENGLDAVAWTTGAMQAKRYGLEKHVDEIVWNPRHPSILDVGDQIKPGQPQRVEIRLKNETQITLSVEPDGVISSTTHNGSALRGKHVDEVFGKEIGGRILREYIGGAIAGDGLKFGGEGLKKLYDRDLVNVVNSLSVVKRNGVKVGAASIAIEQPQKRGAQVLAVRGGFNVLADDNSILFGATTRDEAEQWLYDNQTGKHGNAKTAVPGIQLTPELRQAIMGGLPLFQGAQGAVEFSTDGKALIRGLEAADVSTAVHELAHVARRQLLNRNVPAELRRGITDEDIQTAEEWAGATKGIWTVNAEERFARGFEKYLHDGQAPNSTLAKVFQALSSWLRDVYAILRGSPIDLAITPGMRGVFDRLVTRTARNEAESARGADPAPGRPAARGQEPRDVGTARSDNRDRPGAQEVRPDALSRRAAQYYTSTVLPDAQAQGFDGDPTDLRQAYDAHLIAARAFLADMQALDDESSDDALLRDILAVGGLRPYDPNYVIGAPTTKLRGEYESMVAGFRAQGIFGQRSPFRTDGLAPDDLLGQLQQAGQWQEFGDDVEQLKERLNRISRGIERKVYTHEDLLGALRGSGVILGEPWWEDDSFNVEDFTAIDVSDTTIDVTGVTPSTPEREALIERILDAAAAQDARFEGEAIESKDVKGTDGKWYHGRSNSMPVGVMMAMPPETRSMGWVTLTRDNATVGNRYPSKEAWTAARDERRAKNRAELRGHLEASDDTKLQSQARYFLKDTAPGEAIRVDDKGLDTDGSRWYVTSAPHERNGVRLVGIQQTGSRKKPREVTIDKFFEMRDAHRANRPQETAPTPAATPSAPSINIDSPGAAQVVHNAERSSIEVKFPAKPSDEVRTALKGMGFRWAKTNGHWYKKVKLSAVDANLKAVNEIVGAVSIDTAGPTGPIVIPGLTQVAISKGAAADQFEPGDRVIMDGDAAWVGTVATPAKRGDNLRVKFDRESDAVTARDIDARKVEPYKDPAQFDAAARGVAYADMTEAELRELLEVGVGDEQAKAATELSRRDMASDGKGTTFEVGDKVVRHDQGDPTVYTIKAIHPNGIRIESAPGRGMAVSPVNIRRATAEDQGFKIGGFYNDAPKKAEAAKPQTENEQKRQELIEQLKAQRAARGDEPSDTLKQDDTPAKPKPPQFNREDLALLIRLLNLYRADGFAFDAAVRQFQADYGPSARLLDRMFEIGWKQANQEDRKVVDVLGVYSAAQGGTPDGRTSDRPERDLDGPAAGESGGPAGRAGDGRPARLDGEQLERPEDVPTGSAASGTGGTRRRPTGVGAGTGSASTGAPPTRSGGTHAPSDVDASDVSAPDVAIAETRGQAPLHFVIQQTADLTAGGWITKLDNNMAALRLLKQLTREGRMATADEQAVLAKYIGWGHSELAPIVGLDPQMAAERREPRKRQAREELESILTKEELRDVGESIVNAHYSFLDLPKTLWSIVERLGFQGGSVFEPAVGIGHFFGTMPRSILAHKRTRLFGIDKEPIAAAIAKQLYQGASIKTGPIQEQIIPDHYYDLVISNVPFGKIGVFDPGFVSGARALLARAIHNYYFGKALDVVRPGGLVVFVTSRFTMDAQNDLVRQYIGERAKFLGAVRLPNTAFNKTAGTQVVTDVIVLQKLEIGEAAPIVIPGVSPNAWMKSVAREDLPQVLHDDGVYGPPRVNEYYQTHPEMVLGTQDASGKMNNRPNRYNVVGELTAEQLAAVAQRFPAGVFTPAKQAPRKLAEAPPSDNKQGSFVIEKGKLYVYDKGTLSPAEIKTPGAFDRIKRFIPIREAYQQTLDVMTRRGADAELEAAQQQLRKTYEAFVDEFGHVTTTFNARIIDRDPNGSRVLALENIKVTKDEKGRTVRTVLGPARRNGKMDWSEGADIFTKRTYNPPQEPTSAASPRDALVHSLAWKGQVDLPWMATLLGRPEAAVLSALQNELYQDSVTRAWVTNDDYLSGDVVSKLAQADAAAQTEPAFARNVEALTGVQPVPLTAEEFDAPFGATWIPGKIYQRFIRDVGNSADATVRVSNTDQRTTFFVEARGGSHEFLPEGYSYAKWVELALNGKLPTVKTVVGEGKDAHEVIDHERTEQIRQSLQQLREAWVAWWRADLGTADALTGIYNGMFNRERAREFDGQHVILPNANPDIKLRFWQQNVIWRAIQSGNTLLAHAVGAGKTYALAGIAGEMKRLGLAQKPILVVPNHLVEQWRRDFVKMYPTARVLVPAKTDFDKANRRKLVARIANNEWDAVIIAQSQFVRIGVSIETLKAFIREQEDQLLADGADQMRMSAEQFAEAIEQYATALKKNKTVLGGRDVPRSVKDIVRQVLTLRTRLQKRLDQQDKDAPVVFEQLGVDAILIDEAHLFKNLYFSTSKNNIAGLRGSESQRAQDMYLKVRLINQASGSRNVHFATGTPVSNALSEAYTMFRYLGQETLSRLGMGGFDAWANSYAISSAELEPTADGSYKERIRLRNWANLRELSKLFRRFADVLTPEFMRAEMEKQGIQFPKLAGGKPTTIGVPPHPKMPAFMADIAGRVADIKRGGVDPKDDNHLKISNDATLAAIDMRLVDATAGDYPASRIRTAAKEIARIYRASTANLGTQLVFMDVGVPQKKALKPLGTVLDGKTTPKDVDVDESAEAEDEAEGEIRDVAKEAQDEIDALTARALDVPLYEELKRILVTEHKIPAHEIAFLQQAKDSIEQGQLYEAVNAGTVRVLLASTAKGGTGMNVQTRLKALHHLDVPWRPADMEQREGRLLRQGNQNAEVEVLRYVTMGSFDEYKWGLLGTKQGYIYQFLRGELTTFEDIDPAQLDMQVAQALASGDPNVMRLLNLERDVKGLRARYTNYERRRQAALRDQKAALDRQEKHEERIAALQPLAAEAEAWRQAPTISLTAEPTSYGSLQPRRTPLTFDWSDTESRKAFQSALVGMLSKKPFADDFEIGHAGPYRLRIHQVEGFLADADGTVRVTDLTQRERTTTITVETRTNAELPPAASPKVRSEHGAVTLGTTPNFDETNPPDYRRSLDAYFNVGKIAEVIENSQRMVEYAHEDLAKAERALAGQFKQLDELNAKEAELAELRGIVSGKKAAAADERQKTPEPTDTEPDEDEDDDAGGVAQMPGPQQQRAALPPKLHMQATPPATAPKRRRPISAPDVMHALGDVTEAAGKRIEMRVGRLRSGRALGHWDTQQHVIRTRTANNIPTAAHEVAHALQTLLLTTPNGKTPWVKPMVDVRIQRELVALGRELYGASRPVGGYKSEGWAEFVRIWMTESDRDGNPQDVATKAPLTFAWFTNEFSTKHPEVRTSLDAAKAATTTWRTQGARARVQASVVDPGSPIERLKRTGRRALSFVTFETWVEMAQPLHTLTVEAAKTKTAPISPSNDPSFTLSALRTTHAARLRYMVEHAMIDLAGNPVGPSLNEIKPMIRGRYDDFVIYLWARRSRALLLDPMGPRNPGMTLADAEQVIAELETPAFQLAAAKVYEWNDGVLQYTAEASTSFARVVKLIRQRDPGDYVPLQREFDELDRVFTALGKATTTDSTVKRLKGSGRRIKDPFPVMLAQAERNVRQAHTRLVIEQILKIAKNTEGLGHLIEEVPIPERPVASRTITELLDEINRKLYNQNPGGPLVAPTDDIDSDALTEVVTFFAPVERPTGKDPIVPFVDGDGAVRWYYVNGELYNTLLSMDVYRLPAALELIAGKPAAALRAGTTGLRASFGLITNPARDFQTFYANTQSKKNAGVLFTTWIKSFGEMALTRTTGYTTPWVDAWIRLGGEMAQPLGQDTAHTRRAARGMSQGRVVHALDPRTWFEFYRDLVQFPEGAGRVAELKLLAAEMGWQPGQPMTLDQSLQLLLASKQVTTDFTAAGEFARVMNRMVPFHNAAIQGPRANLRAMRRNPRRLAMVALQFAALSLALWWRYKDEEWYQDLDYRDRFLNWWFPTTVNGTEELIRIPRAFEIGLVFAALPEMLADLWYRQDPAAASEYFKTVFDVATPPVAPVLADVTYEQARNRQWPDRPIVPRSLEDNPLPEQFNEYTTRAAVHLGRLFNASPLRIDHALRNTMGPVAIDVLTQLGMGTPDSSRETEPADWAVIGRLFQRGGRTGVDPKPIDDFYALVMEARTLAASDFVEEAPDQREARLQLEDAAKAISALLTVRKYSTSVPERRDLTAEAADIAREALEAADQESINRRYFADLRKAAQARREAAR